MLNAGARIARRSPTAASTTRWCVGSGVAGGGRSLALPQADVYSFSIVLWEMWAQQASAPAHARVPRARTRSPAIATRRRLSSRAAPRCRCPPPQIPFDNLRFDSHVDEYVCEGGRPNLEAIMHMPPHIRKVRGAVARRAAAARTAGEPRGR
jgi:hypothetical protein